METKTYCQSPVEGGGICGGFATHFCEICKESKCINCMYTLCANCDKEIYCFWCAKKRSLN